MPIIIPTAAEIDRMTIRQRDALTARIPQIRDLLADTITRLERSQRMFPNVADANTRLDIRLGHKQGISRTCRTCLRLRGIERRQREAAETTQPWERAERSTRAGPRQPGG